MQESDQVSFEVHYWDVFELPNDSLAGYSPGFRHELRCLFFQSAVVSGTDAELAPTLALGRSARSTDNSIESVSRWSNQRSTTRVSHPPNDRCVVWYERRCPVCIRERCKQKATTIQRADGTFSSLLSYVPAVPNCTAQSKTSRWNPFRAFCRALRNRLSHLPPRTKTSTKLHESVERRCLCDANIASAGSILFAPLSKEILGIASEQLGANVRSARSRPRRTPFLPPLFSPHGGSVTKESVDGLMLVARRTAATRYPWSVPRMPATSPQTSDALLAQKLQTPSSGAKTNTFAQLVVVFSLEQEGDLGVHQRLVLRDHASFASETSRCGSVRESPPAWHGWARWRWASGPSGHLWGPAILIRRKAQERRVELAGTRR